MNDLQSDLYSDPRTGGMQSLRMAADEQIRQFEAHNKLFDYRLDGWCIWPLLRFGAYSKLESLQGKKIINNLPLGLPEKLAIAIKDLIRLSRISQPRFAVLVQPSNRSERVGQKYKDIYFDDLLLETGAYVKIESMVNRHYLDRGRSALLPSQLSNAAIQLGTATYLRLPISQTIQELANALSDRILRDLNLREYTPRRIAVSLANFYWSKHFYKRLLKHIQPDYFLLTTAYSYHAPVAAAKELGIPVIEFQHGMLDRFHNGYSYTHEALPFKEYLPVPDKIFVYGKHWEEELTWRGFWGADIIPVGNLRMDQYRHHKPIPKNKNSLEMVITTQNIDIPAMIEFLNSFCRLAGEDLNYQLIFKLHPGENDKSRYLMAFNQNPRVQIYLGNEGPSTYELLSGADFHLSIYSTCHYEAVALGVPTIILPLSNHEAVLKLVESGSAFLVETPNDLLGLVSNRNKIHISSEIGEYYFKSRALQNMIQALNEGSSH